MQSTRALIGSFAEQCDDLRLEAEKNVADTIQSFHHLLRTAAGKKFSVTERDAAFELTCLAHDTAFRLGRFLTLNGIAVFLQVKQSSFRQRLHKFATRSCDDIDNHLSVATAFPKLETCPINLSNADHRLVGELQRLKAFELLQNELEKYKQIVPDDPKAVRDRLKKLRNEANVRLAMLKGEQSYEKATVTVTGYSFQIKRSVDNVSLYSGRTLPDSLVILDETN